MRVIKNLNPYFVLVCLLIFPLIVTGQRKELRAAEQAIDNEEFYIAKKQLEKAEPLLNAMNKNFQARFYYAKGMVYLALNADNYGNLKGLQQSQKYFKKVIELGKKADGEYGLKALKETVLNNALRDQDNEDYENAYQKFYNLGRLYPKDTLYLLAAATNAFQTENKDEEAIRLFEQLQSMGFEGNAMQYSAKNTITGQRQFFANKKERDTFVKSGGFKDPEEEEAASQKGKILRFLAELYIRNNKPEKAAALLHDVDDTPKNIDLYRDLTFVHNTLGNKDQYRKHLTTLLENDQDNKAVYALLLAEEMEKDKNDEEAKRYYQIAVDEAPESSEVHLHMAQFLLAKEEKIKKKLKAVKEGEQNETTASIEELKKEQHHLLQEALPYLEKSYELQPQNVNILRALYQSSWMLQDQNRVKKYGRLLKKEGERLNSDKGSN